MTIFVTAKPNSKKESIKIIDATHFVVFVKEPPKDNKANRAIIKLLARHFDIAPSRIQLISGLRRTRFKIASI